MSIEILNKSLRPCRIKWVDSATKSKILLESSWTKLNGNKLPYLSVKILQVVINEERLDSYEDQRSAIKDLNPELFKLLTLHLSDPTGKTSSLSNIDYYIKQVRENFGKKIYTSEDHRKELEKLKDSFVNHKIFKSLKDPSLKFIDQYLREYYDPKSNHSKYISPDRSSEYWTDQIISQCQRCGVWKFKFYGRDKNNLTKDLKDYFNTIKQYNDLKNKYTYKSLSRESDLWDLQKFADYYNIDKETALKIVSEYSNKDLVSDLYEKTLKQNNKDLQDLTNKYKIPLVTK